MTPRLRLHILASGSKGNAYVVEGPEGSLLVDDGLSRRELLRRAAELSIDAGAIRACVVTHEHGDHVRGLDVWCRHWQGTLVASPGTATARPALAALPFTTVEPGERVVLAGLEVETFPTSHDVRQPMGVVVRLGSDSVGICTDTGVLTDEAARALRGARILALESNHDEKMLARGPYPSYLKARVAGPRGHLSNAQAAEALAALAAGGTETVVAMHLSQQNNRPSLAVGALAGAVGARAVDDLGVRAQTPDGRLQVMAAGQDAPMSVF